MKVQLLVCVSGERKLQRAQRRRRRGRSGVCVWCLIFSSWSTWPPPAPPAHDDDDLVEALIASLCCSGQWSCRISFVVNHWSMAILAEWILLWGPLLKEEEEENSSHSLWPSDELTSHLSPQPRANSINSLVRLHQGWFSIKLPIYWTWSLGRRSTRSASNQQLCWRCNYTCTTCYRRRSQNLTTGWA